MTKKIGQQPYFSLGPLQVLLRFAMTVLLIGFIQTGFAQRTENISNLSSLPSSPIILYIQPVADICLYEDTGLIDLNVEISGDDGSGVGFWSDSNGAIVDPVAGIYNPQLANEGANDVTFTYVENGCSIVATTLININFPPDAGFAFTSPICEKDYSTIIANYEAGSAYHWTFDEGTIYSGSGAGPIEVNWNTTGTFDISLSVTSEHGCDSDTTLNTIIVAEPLIPPILSCNTNPTNIEFTWDSVPGSLGFNPVVVQGPAGTPGDFNYLFNSLLPNDSITLALTILGPEPCGDTTITHTCYANDCPDVIINLDQISDICLTDQELPFNLNSQIYNNDSMGMQSWQGPGITDTLTGLFDPQHGDLDFGVNTVTFLYTEQGCSFSKEIEITLLQTPELNSGLEDTISCANTMITFDNQISGNHLDLQWSGPGIVSGTHLENPVVDSTGWYLVSMTDTLNGCSALDSVYVAQGAEQPFAIASGDNVLTCKDSAVVIFGNGSMGPGYEFSWSGPLHNAQKHLQNPVVNQPGNYILTIVDTIHNCISKPDTITVGTDFTLPEPQISQPVIAALCELNVLLLNSTDTPDASYEWYDETGLLVGSTANIQVETEGMYFLHLTDTINGCTAIDSILVDTGNTAYPVLNYYAPDSMRCNQQEVTLDASLSSQGPNLVAIWNGPPGGLTGPAEALITSLSEPGTYSLTLLDTINGCSNELDIDVFLVDDGPVAIANEPEILTCENAETLISGAGSNGIGTLSYQWSLNNDAISENSHVLVDEAGTYLLVVTDVSNDCKDSTYIEVEENMIRLEGALISTTEPSCFGAKDAVIEIKEVFGGTPDFSFQIDSFDVSETKRLSGIPADQYTLMITDEAHCSWDTTFRIMQPDQIRLDLGFDVLLQLGDDTTITAAYNIPESEVDTLIWFPSEMLTCIDSLSDLCHKVSTKPLYDLVVSVTLIDTTGCTAFDKKQIKISKDRIVFIPNIFTPNNDNENDIFMIYGGQNVEIVKNFYVYDRWGEIVHESHDFLPNDPTHGWDGILNGSALSPNVFVYWAEVQLLDGQKLIFKGDVTLLK